MLRKILRKIFIRASNKTVRLIILENGRERELQDLFISESEAKRYAENAGFEDYRVIPQARVEY